MWNEVSLSCQPCQSKSPRMHFKPFPSFLLLVRKKKKKEKRKKKELKPQPMPQMPEISKSSARDKAGRQKVHSSLQTEWQGHNIKPSTPAFADLGQREARTWSTSRKSWAPEAGTQVSTQSKHRPHGSLKIAMKRDSETVI